MIDSLIANLSWPKYYYNHTLIQKDSGFGGEQILEGLRQQPALQRSLCNRKREPSEQENGSQRPWTQNDLLETVEIIILIIWITARLRAHDPSRPAVWRVARGLVSTKTLVTCLSCGPDNRPCHQERTSSLRPENSNRYQTARL